MFIIIYCNIYNIWIAFGRGGWLAGVVGTGYQRL